jgi:aryl-alcohol dehydrogenase-like predicted oxidoreductase
MKRHTFGKTGLSVAPLGFGAAPAAYLKADPQQLQRLLDRLIGAGVNVIDTAASYPGSEQVLGPMLAPRRHELILVSKCGTKIPESAAPDWSAELIGQTIDRALKSLQTDRLDVMLLHSCDEQTLRKGEALGALARARDAGKVKFIGYSGDNKTAAYAATLPDVAVIETSINICDQRNIDVVLPVTRAHDVGVLAKRPIANAAWRHIDEQQGLYKKYAQEYTERLHKMQLTPKDLGFAGDAKEAWPEIALRFTLSQPGAHVAIIGTTNPDNAEKNLAFVEKGPLPANVVDKIRHAFRAADPNGQWRGQT